MSYRDDLERTEKAKRFLDQIQVATPCDAKWEGMVGDNRVRQCAVCDKRVYNLSAMPAVEAMELVASQGDSVCGRFYRRKDGTVLTADCEVGLRRRRRKIVLAMAGAAGVMAASLVPGPPPAPSVARAAPIEPLAEPFELDEEAYMRHWVPGMEIDPETGQIITGELHTYDLLNRPDPGDAQLFMGLMSAPATGAVYAPRDEREAQAIEEVIESIGAPAFADVLRAEQTEPEQ